MNNKYIVKPSDLAELVQYERERSVRTNKPFSLVSFNLSKAPESPTSTFSRNLIAIIASSIRSIDRFTWNLNNSIQLLLPETPLQGGQVVAKRLREKLQAGLGDTIQGIDFAISTYPESNSLISRNHAPRNSAISSPSPSAFFKMHYSNDAQSSDALAIDSSTILDFISSAQHYSWQLLLKRLTDIFFSITGLFVFLPVMVLIALSIKLTSKGPAIFRQTRLGYQGKQFTFLKFRTMYLNNNESVHREYVEKLIQGNHRETNTGGEGRPYYKIRNDPRITPLGRLLRKSSLDELPQLLNVLKGEMSLVGPRPPIPYEVDKYRAWHKQRVMNVKPGITGLWQVSGRSKMTFEEMVRLDIYYAQNWSLWLDFRILCQTFKAVFSVEGAD